MPKSKFVFPTIYNNNKDITPEGFEKSSGLGSGLGLEFMTTQLFIAAQKAGYETYSVLYNTVKKNENNNIMADIVRVTIENSEMIERIVETEDNLRGLTEIYDRALSRKKIDEEERRNLTAEKVKRLEEIESRNSEEELEFQKQKGLLEIYEARLANDEIWKYNSLKNNLHLAALNEFINIRQDQEMIEYLNNIAAQNPPISWNKDSAFLIRERINEVDLKEFLEEEHGNNIFYIREFREGKGFEKIADCFREIETWNVNFPTSMTTMDLHEKLVVRDNKELSDLTLSMDCFDRVDAKEGLINFYTQNCSNEGIVIKPYLSYGGQGILYLKGGISADLLPQRIDEILENMQELESKYNGVSGVVDFSKVIVQKKLHNLHNDNDLYAGDIRFTEINGELIGAALRFKEDNLETALSYARCKNLLPDDKIFNHENIASFLKKARDENDPSKIDYYQNLQETLDVALKVTEWCKNNGHFHVGFDVLIGKNFEGKWSNCLTELNVGWPDCIPETRWINRKCNAADDLVNICDHVIGVVGRGEYISPIPSNDRIQTNSTHVSGPTFNLLNQPNQNQASK